MRNIQNVIRIVSLVRSPDYFERVKSLLARVTSTKAHGLRRPGFEKSLDSGIHAPVIFFFRIPRFAAGKSFWTFSSSRNTGNVRPLPGDCPYHRFFLIRRVFSLLPVGWRLRPSPSPSPFPLIVSLHSSATREGQGERTTTGRVKKRVCRHVARLLSHT